MINEDEIDNNTNNSKEEVEYSSKVQMHNKDNKNKVEKDMEHIKIAQQQRD